MHHLSRDDGLENLYKVREKKIGVNKLSESEVLSLKWPIMAHGFDHLWWPRQKFH